jgi:hypothetical protein
MGRGHLVVAQVPRRVLVREEVVNLLVAQRYALGRRLDSRLELWTIPVVSEGAQVRTPYATAQYRGIAQHPLEQARLAAGLTTDALAAKSGIKGWRYNQIIRNMRPYSGDERLRYAAATGCDEERL